MTFSKSTSIFREFKFIFHSYQCKDLLPGNIQWYQNQRIWRQQLLQGWTSAMWSLQLPINVSHFAPWSHLKFQNRLSKEVPANSWRLFSKVKHQAQKNLAGGKTKIKTNNKIALHLVLDLQSSHGTANIYAVLLNPAAVAFWGNWAYANKKRKLTCLVDRLLAGLHYFFLF